MNGCRTISTSHLHTTNIAAAFDKETVMALGRYMPIALRSMVYENPADTQPSGS